MLRTKSTVSTDNVGFLLAKASQRFNDVLLERFAQHGFGEIRGSYGSVLVPLFEAGELRLGELAAASRLSKQALTGLVSRCEADGLVERTTDPRDRRAFIVSLTHRGKAAQVAAEEILAQLDDELARALGVRDRDALVRALKGVMQL